MGTAQLEFTADELLADQPIAEPLVVAGTVCHGGFDEDGAYRSPRTRHRVPAIAAWQASHAEVFGTELIDVPLSTWPGQFPNVAQARLLIDRGVPEPLMATLTRIGTVEGFGADIRQLHPGDLQSSFVEAIKGMALDHLDRGLFEAHARDEAGWGEQAGHRDMWFAARDLAFEHRSADLDIDAMLERLGFGPNAKGAPGTGPRLLPDDIDPLLEIVADVMIRILLIEVQAFHTFAWAEELLGDRDLVAGDGAAATLVSYIRADETPHVEYLKTALSEMRDLTWVGASGARYAGADMIGTLWQAGLDRSLGSQRTANRKSILGEIEHWCQLRANGDDLLAEFHSLRSPATEAATTLARGEAPRSLDSSRSLASDSSLRSPATPPAVSAATTLARGEAPRSLGSSRSLARDASLDPPTRG
jgi:hypothetical protein